MEEVLLPKVVKEDIRLVEEKLSTGGTRNDLPKERSLHLKFINEVSDTVQTGNELKGKNDENLRLALLDANSRIVTCGRESSAKVELVLLDASGNDDGNNMTRENFDRRIIRAGEKKKPHFVKTVYIYLENGVSNLSGLKLGQNKEWTNNCSCRLGATIVQNFEGIIVQEAWTAPFKVTDKRSKQYEKLYPPLLDSEVWRLDKIGRKGKPCDRLEEENIKTVQDFLFWFYVNPDGLKQILGVGDCLWKIIVAHAETCIIDDKMMYSHKSSTGPHMHVVYDAVGKLKGVHAGELLSSLLERSAFGGRFNTSFNIEASLVQELPYKSSDINAFSIEASLVQCSNGGGLNLAESISEYQTTERGSSSQRTYPNYMGEPCDSACAPFPDPKIADGLCFKSHCYPTSTPSEKDEGDDAQEPLASACKNWENVKPFHDMNHLQQLLLTGWASEMGGELSSRPSNASFCSFNSTMENQWYDADGLLGTKDVYPAPPSPDLMLYYNGGDNYSYNNQKYGNGSESGADASGQPQPQPEVVNTNANEPCAAASAVPQLVEPQPQVADTSGDESGAAPSAEPQPQPQPRLVNTNWLSKLCVRVWENISPDLFRSRKKRKVG